MQFRSHPFFLQLPLFATATICTALLPSVGCSKLNKANGDQVLPSPTSSIHKVEKSVLSSKDIPNEVIQIEVDDPFGEHGAICSFQGAKYTSKELIKTLESKPDEFFKGGILHSPQKVEADSDDMIRDFCKRRDVDLYIHVPLGRAEDTYRHVVKSSKEDR